ncbi:type I polyketide synthase [Nocardia sp. NPDC049526]|uniref:type I polyketide synthase n=1 Tax=Nocardia sp. NPDC049526 TaxID=3364316 RepID=UPI00378B6C85
MTTGTDQRNLLEQALRELRAARRRLESVEQARREPIAVLGAGVRTPGGARDTEQFWQLLRDGVDTVAPLVNTVDGRRDGATTVATQPGKWAGLLPEVDGFDAEFFGIGAAEADHIDPQHRIVLELAWEAMEDAGLTAVELRERRVGVFLGIYGTDYLGLQSQDPQRITAYTAPGGAHSVAANRLSYLLDLRGPSVAVDTACSSSLVAVHLAVRALRAGDCDLALIGGVNVLLSPLSTLVTEKVLPLSPSGRCRTFDSDADGIVRAEGAGVLLLGRAADAETPGRRARAWIRGTAIGHNGRTNGLTAPNPLAQAGLLRAALTDGAVAETRVRYVEAHGTGTALGDPIEVEGIRAVYGHGEHPCAMGSVKTNFGHQEAAAGIIGLIKSILVLEHREVPPHLHLRRLNPEISLTGTRLTIPTVPTPLTADEDPVCAAVSSFGFGGANAHVVLEEARSAAVEPRDESDQPLILPISARGTDALRALAADYAERLTGVDTATAAELCAAAALHRDHHPVRRAAVGATPRELVRILRRPMLFGDTEVRRSTPRVAFVFSGQGTQWPGMARELLATEPVVRTVLTECDDIVRQVAGWSLLAELEAPAEQNRLARTEVAQTCIAAVQLGLDALWRSWGVQPHAVLGHSLGEIVALRSAGALSTRAMFELLSARAAVCEELASGGAMVSLSLPVAQVEEIVRPLAAEVDIAAVNGPRATVVSGAADAVAKVVAVAESLGAESRRLATEYAFHSPLLQDAADRLGAGLPLPDRAEVPVYSTVTGDRLDLAGLTTDHWVRNLRDRVQFRTAVESAARAGITTFLELGPHPALLRSIGETLDALDIPHRSVASLHRDRPRQRFDALAALYEDGAAVRWSAVVPAPKNWVALPKYPWQHRRHWLEWLADEPVDVAAAAPVAVVALPRAERISVLTAYIRERLATALGLTDPSEVPEHLPVQDLGLDSLVIVELKNQAEADLGVPVPLAALLAGGPPGDLARAIVDALEQPEGPVSDSEPMERAS